MWRIGSLWFWLTIVLTGLPGVMWGQTLADFYDQGLERYRQSDFRGAIQAWEQGLGLAKEKSDLPALTSFIGNMGNAYVQLGNHPRALFSFEQTMKIAREIGDRRGEGTALGNIGNVYTALGDYQKALFHHQQALKIAQDLNDHQREGTISGNMGNVYTELGDYSRALPSYKQALKIAREFRDYREEGTSLGNMGNVYKALGDYKKALSHYQQALKIAQELRDRQMEGVYLNNIGKVYMVLGDYGTAFPQFEWALKIAREIGNGEMEGITLGNIGGIHSELGNYPAALSHFEQALNIAKKMGSRSAEVQVLGLKGLIYIELGDHREALFHYEQALKIAQEIGDRPMEWSILNDIGVVHSDLGKYDKALSHFEQALKITGEIDAPDEVIQANMGDVYLEQGRPAEALELFKGLNAPVQMGRYYLQVREYQRARKEFTKIFEKGKQGNASLLLAGYIGLGLALEGLKDYARAKTIHQKAVDLVEEQRKSLTGSYRKRFGAAKVEGFSRMEPYEGLARVSVYLKDAAEGVYWAEHTKARVLLEALARRGAEKTLGLSKELARQETELINRIALISGPMNVASSAEDMRQRYPGLVQEEAELRKKGYYRETILHPGELPPELDEELSQLRKEHESFIARLRRDYPEYAMIRYPQPVRVEELKLGPHEVLIEYEVTEAATFAWLIKAGKVLTTLTIPLTRTALEEEVLRYRRFFEASNEAELERQLPAFEPRLGQALYGLLFKDFAPWIKEADQVILVPDEILSILPFEALVVELPAEVKPAAGKYGPYPEGVRYLGEVYALGYAQSATALAQTRALKRAAPGGGKPLLVVADPVFDEEKDERVRLARQAGEKLRLAQGPSPLNFMAAAKDFGKVGLERLDATARLPEQLRRLYGEIDVLTGFSASEPQVKHYLPRPYRYQVLATHGILDDTLPYLQEPALVFSQVEGPVAEAEAAGEGFWQGLLKRLASGREPVAPLEEDRTRGFLTLTDVMNTKLTTELVALTACSTGVGEQLTGEGVMGLGRAFQYAGAKSVLMSLWNVAEPSTVLLIERFFTHLQGGRDRLEALRQARAEVRQAGYEHPFFWAPFILVGAR